jgi:nucleotide-binding universal stress UspA family protein
MLLFEKILVPLDGSGHSVRALDIAVQIAKKFGGRIALIHVYSVTVRPIVIPEPTTLTPPGIPVITPAEVSKVAEAARETSMRILSDGEEKVKTEGIHVENMLREGHAAQEIIKVARENQFDLIVMGVRGLSKIKEILLGSVSDTVLRNAPCPVLVVKQSDDITALT